ncbi:MAG: hypothetical protein IBJ00_07380, partial [Alphaproteobacteria bacterium]|nr:hypothetical protein [Alphaproteobacteria bacterium]
SNVRPKRFILPPSPYKPIKKGKDKEGKGSSAAPLLKTKKQPTASKQALRKLSSKQAEESNEEISSTSRRGPESK